MAARRPLVRVSGRTRQLPAGDTLSGIAAMIGATSAVGGTAGLVPAPAAGDNVKFLTGAGNYAAAAGGSVQPEPSSASYSYDAGARITGEIESIGGNTRTTTYAYDSTGNIATATINFSGVNRVETYTYDSSGNITAMSATETST